MRTAPDRPQRLPGFLAPLNELLSPAIQAGLGSPLPLTSGFVILEATGRRSGKIRATPLLCTDYGSALLVATVRPDSRWLANLAASPNAHVWLRGSRRPVEAYVFRQGNRVSPDSRSGNCFTRLARTISRVTGAGVVALTLD